MRATHQIEILESHCWDASQSAGVLLAKKAKAEGKTTIPYAEVQGLIREEIEEHFEGRRPDKLDQAHITKISGIDHDGEDEASYFISLHIPESDNEKSN